jgi:hypothetical protein
MNWDTFYSYLVILFVEVVYISWHYESFIYLNFLSVGKLERTAVLKAICSGFKETTDPPVCLSSG